jgi:hypothetical protein
MAKKEIDNYKEELAEALDKYTDKNNPEYDEEFDKKIRALRFITDRPFASLETQTGDIINFKFVTIDGTDLLHILGEHVDCLVERETMEYLISVGWESACPKCQSGDCDHDHDSDEGE